MKVASFVVFCSTCLLIAVFSTQESSAQQPSRQSRGKARSNPVQFAAAEPAPFAGANYKIAPDDMLDIRVFRQPDFNTIARVGYDGSVMVPLVGRIQVAGLAVDEAARMIQSKLAAGFLPDPQVSINVTEFNHRRFTVLGQVTRSGTYDFPDERPLDLLQAIGLAGGYTNIANPSSVTIKRSVGGRITVFKVNAKKLAQGKENADVQVQPGDIITVAESLF
jgi:protein involved in polysaccharide export with SLBB domain